MRKYILRRVLQTIPLLFIISIITFLLMSLAPGEPADMFLHPEEVGEQDLTAIKEHLGVNDPMHIQYFKWVKGIVLEGSLGYSFRDGVPVMHKILERIPATLTLMGTAILIAVLLAVPIGVYSAVKRYSLMDYFFTLNSFLGIAVPSFFIALMVILVFSLKLDWFPVSGMRVNYDEFVLKDRLYHLVLPSLTLAFGLIASMSRFMRSSMLDVINQDYVRTARAKGLSEGKIIYKHALRNALIPFITILALQLPALFGGALFVEQLFAWPGMGRLSINAIFIRDYQIIMGATLIAAVMVVISNLIADILYAFIDPRIQLGKQ